MRRRVLLSLAGCEAGKTRLDVASEEDNALTHAPLPPPLARSIALPTRALFLSAACAVALAVCARNHAGLSHALSRRSGASPKSSSSSSSAAAAAQLAMGPPRVLTALVNPFTATVLLFSGGLLGAAVVLPPCVPSSPLLSSPLFSLPTSFPSPSRRPLKLSPIRLLPRNPR